MSELTQDLVRRYRDQIAQRQTVEQQWDDISRLVQPYRGRFFEDQKHEQSLDWGLPRESFDSTAATSSNNLASRLHGDITSPAIRWFDLRFREDKLNNNKAASKWVQGVSDRIYYELQDSNFDLEVNKLYQDLVGPGTAVMTLEEEPGPANTWNGLQFQSVPLKEAYFEEDLDGGAVRFYRALEWTPQQMIRRFGDDVPDDILQMDKDGNTEKQDVLFAIYPRNNRIFAWGKKAVPSKRPWAFCYILTQTQEMIGKEGGMYEMSAFCARWATTNSSQWGNSPSMMALPDIRQLNMSITLNTRRVAKAVDWPLVVEERANINQLNIGAGTVTVVRNLNGIGELPGRGNTGEMNTEIERLQKNIRDYYYSDAMDFPAPQGTPMSATEAQIRYERLQRYLAPTLGQLRVDVFNPLIERCFNLLMHDGQLEPPPEVVTTQQSNLDIIYLGSLSRSQSMDVVTSIERTMQAAQVAAQTWPEALDVVDATESIRQIGRKMNAPADMMRDDMEVQMIQAQRREAQAQAQQAMLAQEEGEAMKAMGEGQQAMEQEEPQ